MKRVEYQKYGGPEVLRLGALAPQKPGKDEVLVRVKAAAINPFDWKVRNGALRLMVPGAFPRGVGTDFSGVVEAVGRDVRDLAVGDAVVGTSRLPGGAIADMVVTQAKLLVRKPANLSYEAAATLPAPGITAWRALVRKGALQRDQSVFINGALGSVGLAAVQIARALGASAVAGRVGTAHLQGAAAFGIDSVFDYNDELPEEVRHSFDVVLDTHGSLTPAQGNGLRKPGGTLIDTNPGAAKALLALALPARKLVFGTPDQTVLQQVVDLAAAGQLDLPIGRIASLDDAITLFKDTEMGLVKGKAVIAMH